MKTFLTLSITGVLVALIGWAIFQNNQNQSDNLNQKDDKLNSFEQQQVKPSQAQSTITMNQESQNLNLPPMQIDPNKKYQAILATDLGEITIDLFADKTPITVNNFVYLTKKGFYDGTIFHRVIENFMIQGGDPKGNGTGGPGYKFNDEPFKGKYERGVVAMANSGPNTNGSQFFILHQDYALPPSYVIFGEVSQGIEVVDQIATAPTAASSTGEPSKPVAPVNVVKAKIIEPQADQQ